jgi:hypothetical protein
MLWMHLGMATARGRFDSRAYSLLRLGGHTVDGHRYLRPS